MASSDFGPRMDAGSWEVLPAFRVAWTDDVVETHGGLRQAIKYFLRAFSSGIPGIAASDEDFAFTSLFRMSRGDGSLELGIYFPFPKLLEVVRSQLERRALRDVEIHHKYGILEDTLLPLNVVWSPDANAVMLSNFRQLENPGAYCTHVETDTTSGFLSFIGAFDVRRAMKDDPNSPYTVQFDDIETVDPERYAGWLAWARQLSLTATLFDSKRVLVNPDDPEQYVYVADD